MFLDFGYLYVCYVLFLFLERTENNRSKKISWTKFFNIIFLFLPNVGSVGPVYQQINFALP